MPWKIKQLVFSNNGSIVSPIKNCFLFIKVTSKERKLKILLTGITGLVGAGVVTEMLCKHPDIHFVAVIRPGKTRTALQRVEETLKAQCEFDGRPDAFEGMMSHIDVIPGDVTKMPFDEIAEFAPFDAMLHCAADVNLGKDPDGKTYATNLNGTKEALEAVRRFNIPLLHYVSTAYVAGTSVGRVMEDDMPAKGFINSYEHSKFDAEKLVRETCKANNIPFTIYRPSIIVGRLTDGRLRKPLAFYRILEFLGSIKKNRCLKAGIPANSPLDMTIRLQSGTSDKIYFVPIDYVQKAISTLFFKPCIGRTYHVTGDSPVSTDMIAEAVSAVLKAKNLCVMEQVPDATRDELLITRMIGDLMPYFITQITFDQTNIRKDLGDEALAWKMDVEFLKKMAFAYYKQENPAVVD